MQHRLEESARRRPASSAFLVDVKIADALVVAGVEVDCGRYAVLDRGVAEGIENVPMQPHLFHAPFAARRMLPVAEEMIDMTAKKRPHVIPRPARQAQLAPMIVVAGL